MWMSSTTCFWPETIPCGKAHYPPAQFVMLSLQSERTPSDGRNKTGGHSPTPQAHGLGSTFADEKQDLHRLPLGIVGAIYSSWHRFRVENRLCRKDCEVPQTVLRDTILQSMSMGREARKKMGHRWWKLECEPDFWFSVFASLSVFLFF